MKLAPRKWTAYAVALVLLVSGLAFLGVRIYQERTHARDMENLLAIAGVSGPTVFVLEPSEELRSTLKKARRNPSEAVAPLQQALEEGVANLFGRYNGLTDRKSPEAKANFEAGLAYSWRIVLLRRWRPGMKREDIVKSYKTITQSVQTQYDFKNHAKDFFGFE